MSTAAQIAANQQNALLSTGPRTEEGKAVSSQNGVSHGLSSEFQVLPNENQSEFDTLTLRLYEEFNPQGETELFLVNTMAQSRWRLQRLDRLENKAFDFMLGESGDSPDARIIAYMGNNGRDPLSLLQRYRSAVERAYYKAHRELVQTRRADQNIQRKAMDNYIKEYIFRPTPGELAHANRANSVVNGFASQKAPTATPKPAGLDNLALRL